MTKAPLGLPHYELTGHGTRITYKQAGFGLPPDEGPAVWWEFDYHDAQRDLAFRSEQIALLQTAIGEMVTVTLERIPDLHEVTLTVLLPGINRGPGVTSFEAVAIRTTQRTSIAGPGSVEGPLQVYETLSLRGTLGWDPFPA